MASFATTLARQLPRSTAAFDSFKPQANSLFCYRPGVLQHSSIMFLPSRSTRTLLRTVASASSSPASSSSSSAVSVSEEQKVGTSENVSGVLFDMDGVLCNSEERSRLAGVDLFAEMGVHVTEEDFFPFMGTGEANFLGGVAQVYGVKNFDVSSAKSRFFQIYLEKYAKPNSGLGFPGASDLIKQCKAAGLKVALASSADRLKIDANLAAAGLPISLFDAIVSADAFENLKPAPDIFLAAAKALDVPTNECVVVEDALAGLQAAQAAGMRCIAVTTTLDGDKLVKGRPSLIKKDIGDIKLDDIINLQGPVKNERHSSESCDADGIPISSSPIITTLDKEISLPAGLTVTRRDALKYASLLAGLTSAYVAASHWKAMSYASPRALMNAFVGVFQSSIASTAGVGGSDRVSMFMRYIDDLETRGGGQQVPEFESRLEWLNTTPLRFQKDLIGKVVVLDFWTYCCINCMHILPDLEYLEQKYKTEPVTVIGVHSAKFDNEKDLSAITNAVLRYNVTHPVVNDGDMVMWRQLGVNSWPTLVVVSPRGKVLGLLSGEGHRKDLDDFVGAAVQYYKNKNALDYKPLPVLLEKDKDARLVSSPLKFPGKLCTDLSNQRLFISDSNHHRIVVTDLNGNFIQEIGGAGGEGLQDGTFEEACFNRPQGLAYNARKNVLYVADTENHALREIDFTSETVRTLAGNGVKGSDYFGGAKGKSQVLNSPWDVCYEPLSNSIYIAMAGQHQIWQHTLSDGVSKVFSGDGYERNLNGKQGKVTSFAQPSGISLSSDSKELYVADSESSSIRAVDLTTGGSRLLAGGDPMFPDNLFQFGDKDGTGTQAQFQHPLGVLHAADGFVYIADSYNHKVKRMSSQNKTVISIAGSGKAGFKDGVGVQSQLSEPAGLAMGLDGKLYIADTNNSVIRILDTNVDKGQALSTLELKGVQPPQLKSVKPRRLRRRTSTDFEAIKMEPIRASNGSINIQISLPSGYHFTKEVASKFEADIEPDGIVVFDPPSGVLDNTGKALITFTHQEDTSALAQIYCKVYYCQEDEVCLYKAVTFEIPFLEDKVSSPSTSVSLSYVVKPPSLKKL